MQGSSSRPEDGRRGRRLVARLEKTLGPYKSRCAFVPRQMPGADYYRLLAVADVLLHPFPFGGSRTSADGLALGVPVVVRPTTQLRCRMAYSFYASMGLTHRNWTLVASNTNDYHAAAKLANDVEHRRTVAAAVAARQHVIWEDRSVVLGWARFLARVAGQKPGGAADVGLEGDDYEAPVAPADVGLVEEDESAAIEAHERLDRLYRDDTIIEEKRRAATTKTDPRHAKGRSGPAAAARGPRGRAALRAR